MSLLLYMADYFGDVADGKFGGGRPDWKQFLGAYPPEEVEAIRRAEFAAAGMDYETWGSRWSARAETIDEKVAEHVGGYVYPPLEVIPNPPPPPPPNNVPGTSQPDLPPWAPQEEGKLLKDLKKEFDANPVKSMKQLHEAHLRL